MIQNPALELERRVGATSRRDAWWVSPLLAALGDNATIPLKERIVDRYYDPLTMLLGRLRRGGRGASPS